MDKKENCSCLCGVSFPTLDLLVEHQSTCDHVQVEAWEHTLQTMTSPGSECFPCCRVLSLDDVLFNGEMLIYRTYEESVCCSKCRDAWYPYEGKALMPRQDVERYLYLRRTTIPFPWLKVYRSQLFEELQKYLHHPVRVLKWLDSGRELESYME
eukprot:jgi/Phyca11/110176/e_gw1.18.733.1